MPLTNFHNNNYNALSGYFGLSQFAGNHTSNQSASKEKTVTENKAEASTNTTTTTHPSNPMPSTNTMVGYSSCISFPDNRALCFNKNGVPHMVSNFNNSSSTSNIMQSLQKLDNSQRSFSYNLSASRTQDFSQFTNQSTRQTHYFDSSAEAMRYTTFYGNYFNADFRERPRPANTNHSSFWSQGGGSDGGKTYCDSFGNCYSSGGSGNCQSSSSGRCSTKK
jgi:hypothetical protein